MVPQPALKSYFFEGCHKDSGAVIVDSWKDISDLGESLTSKFAYKGENKFLKAVVGFWGWSARVTFIVTTTCWMAVMIALHNSIVFTVRAACSLMIILLRLVGGMWSFAWKIKHPCPTNYCQDCKPHYICPNCGVKHSDLRPSEYGVFRRVCECGASLPTLHSLGRKALECVCSECGQPLVNLHTSTAHVAFVGGPASGKTNIFFMAQKEMIDHFQMANFSDMVYADASQQNFIENRIANLLNGQPVPKTPEVAPKAVHIQLKKKFRPVPQSLYFYDVAGEAFRTDRDASSHAFYDHIDAIIFVIDPLSIEMFSDKYHDQVQEQHLDACDIPPQDAYPRMLASLSSYCSQGASGFKNARIAVTLAKDDLFGIAQEIDEIVASLPDEKKGESQSNKRNRAVREWLLRYDEGHIVRLLETDFRSVRFFSVSALGRVPDPNNHSTFVGWRVLDPVIWSIGHRIGWKE
ncbi:MAG: hypothetical protein WCO51_10195 [bacterium]